jgi:hypothetical protein
LILEGKPIIGYMKLLTPDKSGMFIDCYFNCDGEPNKLIWEAGDALLPPMPAE